MWAVWIRFHIIRDKILKLVRNVSKEVQDLIPDIGGPTSSRKHRAIFGFIGDLSHALFGTATTKDLRDCP